MYYVFTNRYSPVIHRIVSFGNSDERKRSGIMMSWRLFDPDTGNHLDHHLDHPGSADFHTTQAQFL